jgi:uncharacterized membrane protein
MEARPKLKIDLTTVDKLLLTLTLALLAVLWVGTIAFFSKIPEMSPTHYNAARQTDNYSFYFNNSVTLIETENSATFDKVKIELLESSIDVHWEGKI